ncbi:hypothetical protein FDO65_01550 [Nakamurella flava]|uniref:Uncharacterized protein n=1 Tax=Nakamurella flava TaxID=2576308 RepID=A0A4U6QK12_9ACTN|nr:C4-type zinc ribbon domain-containing protein [Nakamurella flava]TKV60428.1 hypothetical protein FDO65_01550 [Nakamurella flava]
MALKADPFVQRRLLDLARIDREAAGVVHRRRSLPELAVIQSAGARLTELRAAAALGDAERGDLDRDVRKLETEIEAVRARSARNAERLSAGTAPAKDLTNLEHEVTSLGRRQAVLEEELLEIMERREGVESTVSATERDLAAVQSDVAAAEQRRDTAFADLDSEAARLTAERQKVTEGMPADLLALYDRIRAQGKVAAAPLIGSRCDACRMDLDRVALAALQKAPVDAVLRCDECGAILLRV